MSAGAVVQRAELGSAVAFAAKVLPRRPVVPVLGGMRVTVGDARVTFAAFDYEVSARAAAEAVTGGSASVLVDGREFDSAVRALPKGKGVTVLVTADEAGLVLDCDGVQMTVPGLGEEAEENYPRLPPMPQARGVVSGEAFARSVLRVAACAGTDDTLPVLTCVHAEFGAAAVRMAATDRYRLAVDDLEWTGLEDEAATALIPAKPLVMFAKAAAKSGKVHVCASDAGCGDSGYVPARVGFTDGVREMTITQYEGEFLKYRNHLRSAADDVTVVQVDAKALHAAVERAAKVTGRNERLSFAAGEAGITLTAMRDGNAAGVQVVPAQFTGRAAETGFNAGYLAGVLSGITGTARIGIADVRKPATVRAADGFTAVIMPVRLQS